ncbi:hypothetical protein ACFL6I_20795 [candidate division KSB1 bacterium]
MPMDAVSAIYSPHDKDLVTKLVLETGAGQHRGKAGAGIGIGNGKGIYIHNGLGRIGDVIDPELMRAYQDLEPVAGIGNVGYTKNKIPEKRNAEPIQISTKMNSELEVVIVMDGYLVKENDLKMELQSNYNFETDNKTEVMGALLHKCLTEEGITFDAGRKFMDKVSGRATFALVALVYDGKETSLVALNDERAFEPFCYGTIDGAFVISSESVSHRRLGGFIEREYDGGEMTICSPNGIEMKRLSTKDMMRDAFQSVYFGHVGSLFKGREIFQIRRELGWASVDHYGIPKNLDRLFANPDSGWGMTIGAFERIKELLERDALDYSRLDSEGVIKVKDREKFELWRKLVTAYPALVKQAQAVRTFQEAEKKKRSKEVRFKFGCVDSLMEDQDVEEDDDSTVKGSVGEGGSIWCVYNSSARHLSRRISYPPMLFPSFKGWHDGRSSLEELAVQRAFVGDNPYDKSLEEINKGVAKLILKSLPGADESWVDMLYNNPQSVKTVIGSDCSYQAMDASYPIDEKFWPDWLKIEVEKFHKYKGCNNI